MFRMLGNKVELIRYTITYTDNGLEEVESCISEEHKAELEQALTERNLAFVTLPINQTGNDWFDGLKFNTYDKALEAFNIGEAAYNQRIADENSMSSSQLRADTDYIAIMMGVDL